MFGWLFSFFGWFGSVEKKNLIGSGGLISVVGTAALTHYLGLDPVTASTFIGSVAGVFATWINSHKEVKDVLGSADQLQKIKDDIMSAISLRAKNASIDDQILVWKKTIGDAKPLVAPLAHSFAPDAAKALPSLATLLPTNIQEQINWLIAAGFDHLPLNKTDLDAMLTSILQKRMTQAAAELSQGIKTEYITSQWGFQPGDSSTEKKTEPTPTVDGPTAPAK